MKTVKVLTIVLLVLALVAGTVLCVTLGGKAEKKNDAKAVTVTASEVKNGSKEIAVTESTEITSGGKYILSGHAKEAQIHVKVSGKESVVLALNGLEISNSEGPAIYVENAGSTTIYLCEGTENVIVSGNETEIRSENIVSEATGGAILLKDDATICGAGSLTVKGYINNGIHCSNNLFIEEGNLDVTALNNGIKGNDSLNIDGGSISVLCAGHGLKSDLTAKISDGEVTVSKSYEGLSAQEIIIDGGKLNITAGDDGINASTDTTEKPTLTVNGGTIYVNASGDGLDSNGSIEINGGTIIVDGPSNNGNGALDSESGIKLNGGTLLAIGASGMAETPDADSAQGFGNLTERFNEGDVIKICDAEGNVKIEYTATKSGNSIVFSFDGLKVGARCVVHINDAEHEVEISNEGNKGFGGGGGFGGGKGDRNFNSDEGPQGMPDGEPPEMPNGQRPDSEMPNGERPERPEGEGFGGGFGGGKGQRPNFNNNQQMQ